VTRTVWLEVTADAVAVTAALADPAGTRTEPGTERLALLSDSATEAPPLGAGPLRDTVQVALPGVVTVVGVHAKPLSVGPPLDVADAVTVPPDVEVAMVLPVGDAAEVFVTAIDVLPTPAASVTFTAANVPFAILFAFMPDARQVYAPEEEKQFKVLPPDAAAVPATAEMEAMSVGVYCSVHSTAAGSLPAGDAKVRFSDAAPLTAVADDKASESVCPKAACANGRVRTANSFAIWYFDLVLNIVPVRRPQKKGKSSSRILNVREHTTKLKKVRDRWEATCATASPAADLERLRSQLPR
jgi:hypothetical protein